MCVYRKYAYRNGIHRTIEQDGRVYRDNEVFFSLITALRPC